MERQPLLIDGREARAILCMLKTNVHDHSLFQVKMKELRGLVESLGIEVVGETIQTRYRPFAKYCIGSGKVKELKRKKDRLGANLVIFYNILKSSQKLNLMMALDIEVIDRYELTLEIFDQMASDTLSKLQIQAARLEKMVPFYKLQASINYRHDRPFFRAGGEYAFHGQLRELTRSQSRIDEEIEKLMEEKKQRIWKRKRELGYPVVCITGFYNAGKTSLFNTLTGDNKPVSSMPFTTLSSKYQRRFIDYETTVIFIDTIGFMLDLDPRLIQSFKLNLLDIRSSDIVLLLLDLTDPSLTLRLKINEGIKLLREIGVPRSRILIVFNKLDAAPDRAQTIDEELELDVYGIPWLCVSAKEKHNLNTLLSLISKQVKHLKEGEPEFKELSSFRKAEKAVNRLLKAYPLVENPSGLSPFESLVKAVLSQNTLSGNADEAYNRLRETVGVDPHMIVKAPDDVLVEAIRSAGLYNTKKDTLREISRVALENYGGDFSRLFDLPFNEARDRLMDIHGVGAKTADMALLWSSHRVIPVDRHIKRVTIRLGLVDDKASYETIRHIWQDAATPDRFKELHLALLKFGREVCTARNPKHDGCILHDMCTYLAEAEESTQFDEEPG